MNMRMGMYANRTIYVDIENQNTDVVDFKASELKLNKPATLLTGIENYPTRLMVRVDDVGVAQKGSKKKMNNLKVNLPDIKISLILGITYYSHSL